MVGVEYFRSLVAEAYRDASLRGLNMRFVTEALEATRLAMCADGDLLGSWWAIDARVNLAAEVPDLQPLLIGLREQWKEAACHDECDRLKQTFQRDPDIGWAAWLLSFAGALADFRLDFCLLLSEAPLPFPPAGSLTIDEIRLFIARCRQGRWAEVFEFYMRLSETPTLPLSIRAQLLCIAAEVAIYHFYQYDRAKAILEKAQDLAATEFRVAYDWGVYFLNQGRLTEAKPWFLRAVELRSEASLGHVGIGSCLERENDLSGAEEKYQVAARCAWGPADGYSSLIQLCGQKSLFEQRKTFISDLVRRLSAVALGRHDIYQSMIEAGYAYQINGQGEEAHRWNRQAIELDPMSLRGYTAEGYLFLEEDNYSRALESFQEAIRQAPEAMEGYWGASWVSEEKEDWAETLRWCQESLQRREQWSATILLRIARAHQHLNQEEEAAETFLRALTADPTSEDALRGLEAIAEVRYKQRSDGEGAERLYLRIRAARGDSYEETYRNLLGNLRYYRGQYREAADEYRKAIATNPKEARFYSNLALAIEHDTATAGKLANVEQAIGAIRQALELQPASTEYQEQLAKLLAQRAFAVHCGESALSFELENIPLRIFVQSDVLPVILNQDGSNLSAEFLEKIGRLKERVNHRCGLTLPGLNFTELQTTDAQPGDYLIEGMAKPLAYARLDPTGKFVFCSSSGLAAAGLSGIEGWSHSDEFPKGFWIKREDWEQASAHDLALVDPADYLLSHVESVVTRSPDLFCGYETVANLLTAGQGSAFAAVRDDPVKLSKLVKTLKARLRRGDGIGDLERTCADLERETASVGSAPPVSITQREDCEEDPEIKSVRLRLGEESALERQNLVNRFLGEVQARLFWYFGVVTPELVIEETADLAPQEFQLRFDAEHLPVAHGASTEKSLIDSIVLSMQAETERRAPKFLGVDTVEHFLWRLTEANRPLIRVTRARFSTSELAKKLRANLRRNASIRNLPIILENLLSEVNV